MPTPPRGFTLVELLVVITIITVLLALLTPAMDRAIYQAELTLCASQQHAITSGMFTYAMEHKRWYPYRFKVMRGDDFVTPNDLADGNGAINRENDDRPMYRPYFSLKMLGDPLAGKVDFYPETTDPDTIVQGGYFLWFGWKYKDNRGMLKIGDSFEIPPTWGGGSFDYMVTDLTWYKGTNIVNDGHPDRDGVMNLWVYQDGKGTGGSWTATPADGQAGFKFTTSRWQCETNQQRGEVDHNVGTGDGAVARINDITWDDPRMMRVPPVASGAGNAGIDYNHLPQ